MLYLVQAVNGLEFLESIYVHMGNKGCTGTDRREFYSGYVNLGQKMKFLIDTSAPKIEVLTGEDGLKKYQLVQRGTDCFTYPFYDRFNFFGLRLDYVADPEPDNPQTTYSCRAAAFILPTDLVPCQAGVTYIDFETEFKFQYGLTRQPYDKITPNSNTRYSYSHFKYYYISKVAISDSISNYFDDDFVEMLVCQPSRQESVSYPLRFWKADFFNLKEALGSHGTALTSGDFLRRITFDSLSGYLFEPDGTGEDGRFAYFSDQPRVTVTKNILNQFFISKPEVFDSSNIGVIKLRTSERFSGMQLTKFAYDLWMKKEGSNIRFELQRLDFDNQNTVLNTISIDVAYTVADEWIHFAFWFGIAPLYAKTGKAAQFKVYEKLSGWHNGVKSNSKALTPLRGLLRIFITG